jgi:FG-GAP repeat
VALSDMWAVVGAAGESAQGTAQTGSAYLFQRVQGTWVEKQHLVSSVPQARAAFGHAVALHGDSALVGAYRDTANGMAQAGSIVVFESLLTTRVAAIAQGQATMQDLHAQLARVAQPMPRLHTAPSGLTLYGGVLEGVPVEDPPPLVDRTTGARLWPALIWQGHTGLPAEVE